MLSARKRTKTPVAPTCRPKSPYSFFFGEPGLFSRISIPTPVPPNPPPVLPVLKRTIMSPVNADLRAGDPEVRPAFGRCVLSLNTGMAALDDQFAGKVLMVTINGDRPAVLPDDLVKALGIAHGIQISDLLVEVCPPCHC